MHTRHPSRVIAGAALLALVLSFIAPFPVLAEETPPPAEPTAEATLPPDTAAPEIGATPAPTDEPPPTASEMTQAAPVDEVAPVNDADAAEPALAELIELAPDGTTIAVVGESGELLPLASEGAAEVIAGGDPVWCPASVSAPTPGLNGCTPSRTRFIELIGDLASLPIPADGIIWIADDYDSSGEGGLVDLNGDTTLSALAPFKLTLRGGWDGIPGSKLITGVSTFNGTLLYVRHWQNDVTLTDLEIANTADLEALVVTTTGNITATRIFSHDNAGTGARLDNRDGSNKAVTVTSSQFEDNGNQAGLEVLSAGKITLTNVLALRNDAQGALLDNGSYSTSAGVSLTGLSTFSENGETGLYVYSRGPITAADLTAKGNGTTWNGYGADLDNHNAPSAQAVTLTGTNIFTSNYSGGLNIASAGAIKLNGLIADSNDGAGAQILNTSAASDQPIILTGSSTFKYNQGDGLYIASRGPVTLNNISASGSAAGRGLEISTTSSSTAGVSLTGVNTFNANYHDGLYIFSNGLIKINSATALGNGFGSGNGYGATLYNAASASRPGVTLTGTNNLSGNRYQGLYLRTKGPVAISNLTASDNNSYGADIDNTASGTASPQKVTLSGKNVFSGNTAHGLLVYTYGAIAASNLTVTNNGLPGNPGAYLQNSWGTSAQPVTLSGINLFTGNGQTGLEIYSLGVIKVSSLTANGNGAAGIFGNGAYLSNSSAANPGAGITLSGTNVFSDNHSYGLLAFSRGPLALANLTASGNGGSGVNLENGTLAPDAPQKVTFTGLTQLNQNGQHGLNLSSSGAVTMAGVTASGNGQSGVYLYNTDAGIAGSAQPVTLNGSNTFNDNGWNGLQIGSFGLIKIANLTASGNSQGGAAIANTYPNRTAGITLSGRNYFADNTSNGLSLSSYGPLTVSSLTAIGNGAYGASLDNAAATSAQKVSLTGTNVFNENTYAGLYLSASGAITLSNLSANGSLTGGGADLSNNAAFTVPITLTGTSTFNGNFGHGLAVYSLGAISLSTTRLEASHNGVASGNGLILTNTGSTPQPVTLKGTVIVNDNYGSGLYVLSLGSININNLAASDSRHGLGAELHNNFSAAVGGVTLSGTNTLQDNWGAGLAVNSLGAVTLNNLTATGNGLDNSSGGATINNYQFPAVPRAVKLTGVNNLSGNYSYGLWIKSNGAISLNSLTASDNAHNYGAYLNNVDLGSVGGITLTGTNAFKDNYNIGLNAYSLGAITVNNLTASGNGFGVGASGHGAVLDNTGALTPLAAKLTGSSTFNDNFGDGLRFYSRGLISANNLTAVHNGGYGAQLNNDSGDGLGTTLTGSSTFSENGGLGLALSSVGPISLSRIVADGNTLAGMQIFNNTGGATITCGSFVNNGGWGAYYSGTGLFKVVGVVASGNPSGDLGWAGSATFASVRACPLP